MSATRWCFAFQSAVSFGSAVYVLMGRGDTWLVLINLGFGVFGAYNALREDYL